MEPDYDTIVIGAGQAGPGLARSLADRGEHVALVEADRFGGTCLNSGCRPTKALRATARAAHVARSSAALGVHVGEVRVDLAEAVARKDALIDDWRASSLESFEDAESIDYLRGRARLDGTSGAGSDLFRVTVDMDDGGMRALTTARVIVNTGATSVPPDIAGLDTVSWLDHHRILHLTEVPEHLIVVGGSYIGLEFGQMFARFGAKVTILEHGDRIVAREDPEVSESITAFLADEGIDVRTSTTIRSVSTADDHGTSGIRVELDGGAVHGSHLLIAAGRVPNSGGLGLDTVGVDTDDRGYITTDDVFRTNVPGIFAVGDVNGRGAFTHTSFQDSEILGDHLGGGDRTVAGRVTTYGLFTDPPLGRVGLTETEARQQGLDYRVVTFPMDQLTRAVLDGETAGLVKLLVDASTDRFIGAAALGLAGDEIVQTISVMMHADVPASVFDTWLPVHPTVAEFFPTITAALAAPDEEQP